ncbi:AraC family transcriptional regulator [Flavobacteriaceae bacterium M23B6Z8]
MDLYKNIHREITPLTPSDSFLVFDRVKDKFDFPIHFHPEYELNYIENASGLRRVVGNHIEETKNLELVLIGPNLYHSWQQHKCNAPQIREITIQFHNDLLSENMLNRSLFKPVMEMLQRSAKGILFSQSVILRMAPRIKKLTNLEGMEYFVEALSILYDLAISKDQRLLSEVDGFEANFENSGRIQQVYKYIQEEYARKITLAEVAELVNMSTVSFNRFIKKRTGKTLIEYVNDVRMGYASRRLLEKDLNVSEIAYTCGFNSLGNFNRLFKQKYGVTPTEYRVAFSGIRRVL